MVSVPPPRRPTFSRSGGFGLVEAIVSSGVLIVLAAGLLQLFTMATTAMQAAAEETSALLLAVQRMEQLRGLVWSYDATGRALSDLSTNVSADSSGPDGRGLGLSPPNSLTRNTRGYVDHLDRGGGVIGSDAASPPGTFFVRRWSVRPLSRSSRDLLVLQVVVMPAHRVARGRPSGPRPHDPGVVWLTSLKGRH